MAQKSGANVPELLLGPSITSFLMGLELPCPDAFFTATGLPMPTSNSAELPAEGVVAVIVRHDTFLVIRRSMQVRAPGAFCFPGGGVEAGETNVQALRRELEEELSATSLIHQQVWTNTTPSGIKLSWYLAELGRDSDLRPNPAEVASIHWWTEAQLRRQANVLSTNLEFLDALSRGAIRLERQ